MSPQRIRDIQLKSKHLDSEGGKTSSYVKGVLRGEGKEIARRLVEELVGAALAVRAVPPRETNSSRSTSRRDIFIFSSHFSSRELEIIIK